MSKITIFSIDIVSHTSIINKNMFSTSMVILTTSYIDTVRTPFLRNLIISRFFIFSLKLMSSSMSSTTSITFSITT